MQVYDALPRPLRDVCKQENLVGVERQPNGSIHIMTECSIFSLYYLDSSKTVAAWRKVSTRVA